MSIITPTYNFPTFPVQSQLFYVPGAVVEGGFTSGGARISMAEPGGYSMLEIQPSMITSEFLEPIASWLMSMTNSEVFRVRLAPTPQVSIAQMLRSANGVPWNNGETWDNDEEWSGEPSAVYGANATRGTNVLTVDMSALGTLLRRGHVIGHAFDTYLIHAIDYDEDTTVATITVKPSLRRNVVIGDSVVFRPWFTGQINNGADFRTPYDAVNIGLIELNKIVMSEVVLP